LLFGLLAASYGAVIPLFEGPDENAHFGYIAYLQQTGRLPALTAEVAAISHELVQQPPLYYGLAALINLGQNMEAARQLEQRNPYAGKGMSKRYTFTLPNPNPWAAMPLYLSRAVAWLGALLTVWGSWQLTRALLPNEPLAALAVASVVGLNPQFLFSAATITNDTWAAALFTWSLWCVQRACWMNRLSLHQLSSPALAHKTFPPFVQRQWLLAGLVMGLATLTKYSAWLVVVPAGFWFVQSCCLGSKIRHWRAWLSAGFLWAIGCLLSAGFWHLPNLWRYGSMMPIRQILILLPDLARERPLSLTSPDLWTEVGWLLRSYWGVFGYGIVAPANYHWVVQNLLLVAVLGLFFLAARAFISALPQRWTSANLYAWLLEARKLHWWLILTLALVWFLPLLFSLIHWMRIIHFGNQGRLLFPGAPALGLALVIGWQAWLPTHWRPWLYRFIPLCFAGLAISQLGVLYENYRLPPGLKETPAAQRPLNARFVGGMSVLGVDLPQGAGLRPDHPMPLTIYFSADERIADFYTLFLHLADKNDQLLYQFDGVPVQGRHPTAQWLPGAIFADTYWIQPPNELQDGLATLSLGFYPIEEPSQRQPLVDSNGAPLGDRLVLARVRLHQKPRPPRLPEEPVLARWAEGIVLSRAQIAPDAAGDPQILRLTWQAAQVLHIEYTVFAQLLDREGKLLAQVDQLPQQGSYPTSTWQPGDRVEDHYRFSQPAKGWHQLIIGLYDQQGRRLPLQTPNAETDFFVLAQNPKDAP
jgi:hypothetical protein